MAVFVKGDLTNRPTPYTHLLTAIAPPSPVATIPPSWLLQGADLDIMKNLTRRSDAGQGGPFHKALKLVERASVLSGKV